MTGGTSNDHFQNIKPLFIAKSYPPTVGGMERFSFNLAAALASLGDCRTIANHRGPIAMPLFAPASTVAAAWQARKGRVDVIHLGDALLAPFGVALQKLAGVPVTVTIHGLDILRTTPPGYQTVIGSTITRLDHLVAVSPATRDACLRQWPSLAGRVSVIPNGVDMPSETATPRALPRDIEARLAGRHVVLNVGRLVRRKGVAWFIERVLPLLPDVTFVVAGEGPDREAVEAAAGAARVEDRVLHIGRLDDGVLDALYRRADVFVMPNIIVPNDVEGFGLVSLEAAVRGTPVVAANLQGIPAAVQDGRNGYLVTPEDPQAFASKIRELLDLDAAERRALGERFRVHTVENFSWRSTAAAYWRCFESVVAEYRRRG